MLLADQVSVFLWTLAIGMLAGFCHVVYRVISNTLRLKRMGIFAGDIIFWIVLTVIAFGVLLKANYGQLRLYVFIGLFMGAFLFNRFLGGRVYRIVGWWFLAGGKSIKFFGMLLYYSWRAIAFPFKIVFIVVIFPVQLLGRLLGGAGRFTGRLAGSSCSRAKGKFTSLLRRLLKKLSPPR
ncbi:MAG: spore cortex biosynthesis protein YabQ [Desulfocucumaceae bacterium]